jgi:hypothetical protein
VHVVGPHWAACGEQPYEEDQAESSFHSLRGFDERISFS